MRACLPTRIQDNHVLPRIEGFTNRDLGLVLEKRCQAQGKGSAGGWLGRLETAHPLTTIGP